MATISITKCDNCGKEKKEKDAWLQAAVTKDPDSPEMIILGRTPSGDSYYTIDLCSPACLHKKIDELLKLPKIGRPKGSRTRKPKGDAAEATA